MSTNEDIKEIVDGNISFMVRKDYVEMAINLDALIDVALMAFKREGLIYTYEVDAGKRMVRVKIPASSMRGFIEKNAQGDPRARQLIASLFNLPPSNEP